MSEAAPGGDATIEIVSLYRKEATIHARAVHGWFAAWRWVFVWLTQLVFYGLPWLGWNGRQAVLFDLIERRFYIFGLVLHPQDFIYLTALLIICAVALLAGPSSRAGLAGLVVVLATLPWLSVKYVPVVAAIALLGAWRWRGRAGDLVLAGGVLAAAGARVAQSALPVERVRTAGAEGD